MRYFWVLVYAPLDHRGRLVTNSECQKIGFIPTGYRFNKRTHSEIEFSDCPYSVPINLCVGWVCYSCFEQSFIRFINFAKRYQLVPYFLFGCTDYYFGLNAHRWRCPFVTVSDKPQYRNEQHGDHQKFILGIHPVG